MPNSRVLTIAILHLAVASLAAAPPADFATTTAPVGHADAATLITPVNQIVTPAGKLVELPGEHPQALALSSDNNLLVVAGLTNELTVLDPATGKILQRVPFPADKNGAQNAVSEQILDPKNKPVMSMNGLVFSPDGSRIYLSNTFGEIKVFSVAPDGKPDRKVTPLSSIALPPANAPDRAEEIPAGLALSPDGKKLYVALNLSNRLAELDAATGKVLRLWPTGVAPFDIVATKNKLYITNWGGRRPAPADAANPKLTGPAGHGMTVRTDARGVANEGSLTIIDLAQPPSSKNAQKEIPLGPHASALALSPDKRWLVVAATADDTLYVIDTRADTIAEKISARQNPADPFGAQPTALAFAPNGRTLYAANGTQNAIAVFRFDPADKESAHLGLIPAGWFPSAIACDAKRNQLCVGNMKDIATHPEKAGGGARGDGFKTKQYCGTLSLIPIPATTAALAAHTQRALANLRYPLLAQAALPPRPGLPPVPVPERAGEPSVFKHVIYIIKENRTYDQVLGDIPTGNGAPDLCAYGENITPNQHKIAREFVLLDNTYCSGIQSADGHQWANSAIATDYVERQGTAGWPRSYPDGDGAKSGHDALAYAPTGFIWTNAAEHGKTVANFGEFTIPRKRWKDPARKDKIDFAESWKDFATGANEIDYSSEADIESLRPFIVKNTIGWDLSVPDAVRAAAFIRALKTYEQNDNLPNLVILYLPNDHTAGTNPKRPTPEAMVADNDLAMGQVIEALSHTKYWADTCVLAIEDDPQNGWDHISGYRTTAYVASAYTKRAATISTQYNQTSLLRTIELILGLPPMNQLDATATPMSDCFIATPDLTPFTAVPNRIPLDQMSAPNPKKIPNKQQRKDALASANLPLDKPDQCDEDTLNRILWRAAKGPAAPYPEWAVKPAPDDD